MFKLNITGLEQLQREFAQAKRALESLDGEITSVQLSTGGPLETQQAIHRMEAAVDEKVSSYRNNSIVSALAEAMKESFRQNILELASKRRNEIGDGNQDANGQEDSMNPEIELKRKHRFEFMNRLYEVTNGNEDMLEDMAEIGMSLDFSKEQTHLTVQYLAGEGLLKYAALGGIIRITHLGVVEVESALQAPEKPTQHFPPVQNIIHIGTMTNSVIQQHVRDGAQTVSISPNDKVQIGEFLELLSRLLPKMEISESLRSEVRAEVETLKSQLISPKPKREIVRSSLDTLLGIFKAAGNAALTGEIAAHLPAIEAFIRTLGN